MEEETQDKVDIDLTPQNNTRMKPLTIIGSVIGVLVLLTAVLIFADPFNLNLLARLQGDYDPTIQAMPLDTVAYVQLNVLEANINELNDLGQIFQSAFPETDEEAPTPITEQELAGMEITLNDILSWAGQFAAIGLLDLTIDEFNQPQEVQWVAAIEVRDEENALAFVDKLSAEWERTRETAPSTQTVQEATVTVLSSGEETDMLFVTLSDGLMLMGSHLEAIETAIETQNGRSLAEDSNYQATLAQLTTDPFITAYINDDKFYELLEANVENNELVTAQTEELSQWREAIQGIGMRVSFADNGFMLEQAVPYNPDLLTEMQKTQLNMSIDNVDEMVARVPEDAFMYMMLPSLADFWQAIEPTLLQTMDEAELEESLQLAEEQFGINPVDGLLTQLDGESILIVQNVDTSVEADAEEGGDAFPVTISGLFVSSQTETLVANMEGFRTAFANEETGMGTVTELTEGDFTIYQLSTLFLPDSSFYYTIHEDAFVLTSHVEGVTGLVWDGGTAVSNNPKYQQAKTTLGHTPFMFLDAQQALQTPAFSEMPDDELIGLVDHVAMATASSDNVYTFKAVVIFTEASTTE